MSQSPSANEQARIFKANTLVRSANAAMGRGDLREAIELLQGAMQIVPEDAGIRTSLGDLLQMIQRPREAEAAFRDALQLSSREPRALAGLAKICLNSHRPQEAEDFARRAIEVWPANAYVPLVLARALADQGQFEESDAEIGKALAANPDDPVALHLRAGRFRESGKFAEARRDFKRAVEISPGSSEAYWGYVQCGRATEADNEFVQRMEDALAGKVLDRRGRTEVLLGLGKVNDDLGRYEQAMRFFTEANRLRDQDIVAAHPFRKEDYVQLTEITKEVFSADSILANRVNEPATPYPIFVVGMPRSGTTLVEHIISSHPSVAAGGEIWFWLNEFLRCVDFQGRRLDPARALTARAKYLEMLKPLANGSPFVTDKMPENYRALGLIAEMFPEAKFIHCSRDPVDTCLSIYFMKFHEPPHYSADLDKLVFTYRLYLELMDHWRQALPAGTIWDVRYADLVQDPEAQTRRIIEFCGLPWDEACLHPEKNERAVFTASAWQTRQRIYTTSLDRWRNYEPWLGPLAELLKDE